MPENGAMGFLNKDTAGLPNWAWILVVAAGIGAAYFIPKWLGTSQPDQTSTGTGTGSSGIGLAIDPTTGLPYAVEGLVPSGANAGSPTQGAQPTPTPTPSPAPTPSGPLIPFGSLPASIKWETGQHVTWQGQTYTISVGSEGRLWGVPGTWTAAQVTGKPGILLYQIPQIGPGMQGTVQYVSPGVATNKSLYGRVPGWPQYASSLADMGRRYNLSLERVSELNPGLSPTAILYPGQRVRVA